MNDDLLPVGESLSPKLRFLKKHNLTPVKQPDGRWMLGKSKGADEDEAILNYCFDTDTVHWSVEEMVPHIFVEFDVEEGNYRLMCKSIGQTSPAGPRLYCGGEPPSVGFVHDTEEAAVKDAAALQGYVNTQWMRKIKKWR